MEMDTSSPQMKELSDDNDLWMKTKKMVVHMENCSVQGQKYITEHLQDL